MPVPMDDYLDTCLSLLEAMNAAANAAAWPVQSQIYEMLLSCWTGELARRVVRYAVMNCRWRPTVAELREIAAKIESPIPARDEAFAEVIYYVREYGMNAAPHPKSPDNPNIRACGPPRFSHPLVAAAVRRCGGWEAICEGAAQYQGGGLSEHFKGNYDRAAEGWYASVAVALESGERPAELFPDYRPFDRVTARAESRRMIATEARPALPAPPAALVPMPENVRKGFERLGAALAMPEPETDPEEILIAADKKRELLRQQAAMFRAGQPKPADDRVPTRSDGEEGAGVAV